MKLVVCTPGDSAARWTADLKQVLPEVEILQWPEADEQATLAVVWKPPQALLDAHPRLQHVFNLGAGVDALRTLRLPAQTRLVRLEDAGMAEQMAEYVCHALLRHFRGFDRYEADARRALWQQYPPERRDDFPVGVMGLGQLGVPVARAVARFGFPVRGWSRRRAALDGITCHAGDDELDAFLTASRVLVCLLPLTPQTEGILNRRTLGRLRRPGYLINIARGGHLVDADLLALLDEGRLAGACLDVFHEEPLPADHPLRRHPAITITPHISAMTLRTETLAQIAAKIRALRDGRPISGIIRPELWY